MRDKLVARFATLRQRLRTHAGWLWGIGFAVTLITCSILIGISARSRADVLATRVQQLERSLGVYDSWTQGFRPAAAAESAAWLEGEQAVRDLGLTLSTRVAIAELIARRAEDIGIPDVMVRVERTDTISFVPLTAGTSSFDLNRMGYAVELTADAGALRELLRMLPPHVDARHVRLHAAENGMRARVQLITYRNSTASKNAR